MKKMFLIIIAAIFVNLTLFAGDNSFSKGGDIDVPFFKSFFINKEEYVKQELLKCKDVEVVEMKVSYQDEDDLLYEIHIYLSNHRYLCFDDVVLDFYKRVASNKHNYIILKQINDLAFLAESFKANQFNDNFLYYQRWIQPGEIKYLTTLSENLNAANMIEIIENIDEVYKFIECLPQIQSDYTSGGRFEYPYNTLFQVPIELDNEVPVSVIEKKKTYDSKLMVENWYEEAYKFYKLPIKEAKNQNIYISDY